MRNRDVAAQLRIIARLLHEQGADVYRINSYLKAADEIARWPRQLDQLVAEQGFSGLLEIPGVGAGIGRCVYEYIAQGRMSRLEQLREGHDPIHLFEQIPGVGIVLANRLVDYLHLHTLEALELAAHNGDLAKIHGFTQKKIKMIQLWLAHVLGPGSLRAQQQQRSSLPSVDLLLQMDHLYREKSRRGELKTIAPKRFNPSKKSWLPLMHSSRAGWHFTLMYSNTLRAHQLKRCQDWVLIYYYDSDHHEGQSTVVTQTHGPTKGKRVVRGREAESSQYYLQKAS